MPCSSMHPMHVFSSARHHSGTEVPLFPRRAQRAASGRIYNATTGSTVLFGAFGSAHV